MKIFLTLAATAVALAGCQSAGNQTQTRQELAAEIAAKQGPEVSEICFIRNIDGWRELGRKSLLLGRGVNDWFQVELTGTCDPQFAFDAITLESRPATSCLGRGDKINTPDSAVSGSCFISRIYEWNEDAPAGSAN